MAYFFYNTDKGQNRFHILIKRGIAATGGPRRFGIQLRQLRPLDVLLMYEDGIGIVAVGRVQEYWDGKKHTKILYYPSGEPHEYRIKVKWFLNLSNNPINVATIKEELGYHPRGAVRRIVKRHDEVERMINQFRPKQNVSEELAFLEGEQRAAKSTARNPQLRKAAKKRWGVKCYCCGFDYEVFYGGVAKGLAIVHHLQLFHGSNGKPRKATVKDVRVVCANCHYVLHVENPPIDVEDLKNQRAESWTFWSDRGTESKR